jgi:hypothetical protein
MSTPNVGIAIDGSGIITITFLKAKLRTINLTTGPNAAINIEEATETVFRAGECSNNWFRTYVEFAAEDEFLVVQVVCPADASMNFIPDGFSLHHVNPGKTETLFYSRKSGLKVSEEKAKEAATV